MEQSIIMCIAFYMEQKACLLLYNKLTLTAECHYSYSVEGNGLIVMDNVHCVGSESRLIDCIHDSTHNCEHDEYIAVDCGK